MSQISQSSLINKTLCVPITKNISDLIAERDLIVNRGVYRKGDGDRLYQIQVRLSSYFCDSYARAVQ